MVLEVDGNKKKGHHNNNSSSSSSSSKQSVPQPPSTSAYIMQTVAHDAAAAWGAEEAARRRLQESNVYKCCKYSVVTADKKLFGEHQLIRYMVGFSMGLFVANRYQGRHTQ